MIMVHVGGHQHVTDLLFVKARVNVLALVTATVSRHAMELARVKEMVFAKVTAAI